MLRYIRQLLSTDLPDYEAILTLVESEVGRECALALASDVTAFLNCALSLRERLRAKWEAEEFAP